MQSGDEACDDGNTDDDDGCAGDCASVDDGFVCVRPGEDCVRVVTCGNGRIEGPETCDDRNATAGGPSLQVRIGVAAGEPVDRGDDIFGWTVNLASRICDAAEARQILTSDVVHELGASQGFRFRDVGTRTLKGFLEPAPLFELIVETDREPSP